MPGEPPLAANVIRNFLVIDVNGCGVLSTAKAASLNITDPGALRLTGSEPCD